MLDNAIDAAVETEGKQPIVKVAIFNKGTARYYIVENDMVHEKLPTHLIFEDGYSTKTDVRIVYFTRLVKNDILKVYVIK